MPKLKNKLDQKCELEFEFEDQECYYFSGGFNLDTNMELSEDEVEWFNENYEDTLYELMLDAMTGKADDWYDYVKEGN